MDSNIIGRSFSSGTIALKNENGDWEVIVDMTEKRLIKGGEWETKVVDTKCTDSTFEKAYEIAMKATLEKFNDALAELSSNSLFGQGSDVELVKE